MVSIPAQTQLHALRAADRAKLDEEITQLEGRLLSLKRARNALAPIMCLHPEVLQEIFFFVHYTNERKGKGTLLITSVSHQWRDLALNNSALWCHIDFVYPEWVRTALVRAKDRELEFNLQGAEFTDMLSIRNMIPYTIGNMSRIKKLQVVSRDGDREAALPKDTPEWLLPAPNLVDLNLEGVTLPRDVFSGTIPSLRSLRLENIMIYWDKLPVTRGLKHLHLVRPQMDATVDEIMKALQVIGPDLETLTLQHTLVSVDQAKPMLYPSRFKFEKLKFLKINGDTKTIAQFLDLILVPHRVTIEVDPGEWMETTLLHSLVSCRNIDGRWPVDTLEVDLYDSSRICMRLRIVEDWSDRGGHSDKPGNNQTHIELKISRVIHSEFFGVFNVLPIQTIKKVCFSGGFEDPQDVTALNYIGKLGTVQEMRIEFPFMATFLSATQDQDDELEEFFENEVEDDILSDPTKLSVAQNLIAFNKLREMEIYGPKRLYRAFTFKSEEMEILQKWLEWRKRVGIRLERLTISGLQTPSVSWMAGIFGDLVQDFQTSDLQEQQPDNDFNMDGAW